MSMFNMPVVYMLFNRPRHTRETFAAIRALQPARLFIVADGPRSGHANDRDRCREVRSIVEAIDWPCEVHRNYADHNLGLKRRISSGLDWVFATVDRAIVLEDDCLPHPDFFPFCAELLERYADDGRVWVITGNNFQGGRKRGEASYYFSRYNHCWGWATWRRAWQHCRVDLPFWPEWKNSAAWRRTLPDKVENQYWTAIFDKVWRGEIDSWAYPWTASTWYHQGLTATPNVNLVTNIGFGPEATHTIAGEDCPGLAILPLGELTHPHQVKQNLKADRYVFDYEFGGIEKRLRRRLANRVKAVVNGLGRLMRVCAGHE